MEPATEESSTDESVEGDSQPEAADTTVDDGSAESPTEVAEAQTQDTETVIIDTSQEGSIPLHLTDSLEDATHLFEVPSDVLTTDESGEKASEMVEDRWKNSTTVHFTDNSDVEESAKALEATDGAADVDGDDSATETQPDPNTSDNTDDDTSTEEPEEDSQ